MMHNIKGKERVENFGEVNTSAKEIDGILDMLVNEVNRVDSKFYEPACGDGNFLTEILKRKINFIEAKYKKNKNSFQRNLFLIVCNLYGVDILQDNIFICRERLLNILKDTCYRNLKNCSYEKLIDSMKFVISKNILWGDALTLERVDSQTPIIFSEWSFVNKNLVKRINYKLSSIVESEFILDTPLFSDLGEDVYMPSPVKVFELQNYLDLKDV